MFPKTDQFGRNPQTGNINSIIKCKSETTAITIIIMLLLQSGSPASEAVMGAYIVRVYTTVFAEQLEASKMYL